MAAVDPFKEMTGRGLRNVVIDCVENGRVAIPTHASDRMDERSVTAPEIEAALCRGAHSTESCAAGKWRYSARKNDVEVIFAFDLDEDGNILVVVTVMRKER